jgi:hypothetical protein
MRVVESGLRAFCAHVGFREVRETFRPSGKHKYVPVEYAQWEKILDQLQPVCEQKILRIKNKRTKQLAQEFYFPVIQEVRAIKDAWRNHVMHSRRTYTKQDAEAILDHSRRLMRTLAARIKED